jgi:glycerophosphoryl diester phosphodiesterase
LGLRGVGGAARQALLCRWGRWVGWGCIACGQRSGLQLITPTFTSTAHLKQLRLHVWTVNETDAMRRMMDAGVDGIITDYPDRLLALLNR